MSTHLKTGLYIIENFGQSLFVGRNLYEDLSLNPKQVVSLPQGVQAPKWIVEALPNGAYRLSIGGAPTGPYERKVWAFLIGKGQSSEWIIKPGEIHNTYFITTKDGQTWSLPTDEPFTQIPLGLVGVELKNTLWRFFPLHRDE